MRYCQLNAWDKAMQVRSRDLMLGSAASVSDRIENSPTCNSCCLVINDSEKGSTDFVIGYIFACALQRITDHTVCTFF
jgi:hypothetical protein